MVSEWLNQEFNIYLDSNYYEKILPSYKFKGKSDEELLETFLKKAIIKRKGRKFNLALEMGCGSGRGTKILSKYCKKIVAVDLSKNMLELAKERLPYKNIIFENEEMFNFIKKNINLIKKVDLVVSFWAINYSLNAEFAYRNPKKGIFKEKNAKKALSNCLNKLSILFDNLPKKSEFIFFHYDPESEEQKIAHKCWEKILSFPFGEKSPSLFSLKNFFEKRDDINSNIIKINGFHYFRDIDHAMEIFMNFHLHTSFNRHHCRKESMSIIRKGLNKRPNNIKIGAGVIIIQGEKI